MKSNMIVLGTGLLLVAGVAQAQPPPSKEITLADWGFKNASEIGYLSVGLLHKKEGDELVVHDIRKQKPTLKEPEQAVSRVPKIEGDLFLVARFDRGNLNRLNGYFNAFVRAPSQGALSIGPAPDGTSSLAFSYQNQPPGFAGFWVHLFDFKAPPTERVFLDATPFTHLTFSIRGAKGDEDLVLQVADYAWEKKEDSLKVGKVKVTKEWQQVWVDLTQLPKGLDKKGLASIVFQVQGDQQGAVYLKNLAFTKKKDIPIPISIDKQRSRSTDPKKAMWLWEAEKIFAGGNEEAALLAFCKAWGMTDLFVQIPYEAALASLPEAGRTPEAGWKIRWNPTPFRSLNRQLQAAGIRVHALDGDPRYALEEYHGRVLAFIGKIAEYNKSVPQEERFVGIRYDIEPYLLPNFGGVQKEAVLKQYLSLLEKSKLLTQKAGLELGVDLPFWFDGQNEFFEPSAAVGGRPMSELIIDRVDTVGIMDYRTVAYGADGVIAHGGDELAYASKRGKKVFVGLETVWLPNETQLEFQRQRGGRGAAIVIGELGDGRARLTLNFKGGTGAYTLSQTRSVDLPSSKITFFGKTKRDLQDVMEGADREFSGTPSFLGFAIHSYEGFRPWSERQK